MRRRIQTHAPPHASDAMVSIGDGTHGNACARDFSRRSRDEPSGECHVLDCGMRCERCVRRRRRDQQSRGRRHCSVCAGRRGRDCDPIRNQPWLRPARARPARQRQECGRVRGCAAGRRRKLRGTGYRLSANLCRERGRKFGHPHRRDGASGVVGGRKARTWLCDRRQWSRRRANGRRNGTRVSRHEGRSRAATVGGARSGSRRRWPEHGKLVRGVARAHASGWVPGFRSACRRGPRPCYRARPVVRPAARARSHVAGRAACGRCKGCGRRT
jgi:hypothetical protein